jgi:phytoene dehydrogenase-like protein
VRFAFIGGGFAGLVTGARLVEAGVDVLHPREGR